MRARTLYLLVRERGAPGHRAARLRRAVASVAALALAGLGCGPPPTVRIELALPAIDGVEAEGAPTLEPPGVALFRRGPLRWQAVVEAGRTLVVRAPFACPRRIGPLEPQADPAERFVRLSPLFELQGERAQVGFGAPFALRLVPGCGEAGQASLRWEPQDEIREFEIADGGRTVRGRMPSLEEAGVAIPTAGVVPVSPRTRGTRRLALTVTLDGWTGRRQLAVHAAARQTGVPSVGLYGRVLLAGTAVSLVDRPPGSRAALWATGSLLEWMPDVRGRYVFSAEGGGFAIYAGSHAATDLDCGRAECHAALAARAAASPMSTVLSRRLEDPGYAPGCAVGCHAAGEPGVHDGGFSEIAAAMGAALPSHGAPGAYAALPRELRRLGGVGCTACHGPGAIPEPSARGRILRIEVCATCHDAPPRYGHVAAWSRTSMAGRDDDPALLAPPCVRCHSTEGLLGIDAPPVAEIGCAACHAPHAAEHGPRLLRSLAVEEGLPAALAQGPSRPCVACHSAEDTLDLPAASAVVLLTGRALGAGGQRLSLPAPHAELPRGCLSCHGTLAAEGLERGGSHSFAVDPAACAGCHEDRPAPPELGARLLGLEARFGPLGRGAARPGAPADDRARARWDAALLSQDGAAWAHAGRGAEALLEVIEALAPR